MTPLSRRQALRAIAATAGLAAVGPAVGGLGSVAEAAERASVGSRPFPRLSEGTDTLPQIEHIVVLMMENHSFDSYFGMLGRGDGYRLGRDGQPLNSCPGPDGKPVRAYHSPSTCQAHYHVGQDWDASHRSWDYGRNDGFVRATSSDAMAY